MMRNIISAIFLLLILDVSVFASPDSTIVEGDLKITGTPGQSGIVFPDGSVQYHATVQGPIGPQGPAGTNGLNSLISMKNEAAGTNCSNGGIKIQVGLDKNRNGLLDIDEVSQTKYVCNRTNTLSAVNITGTWVGTITSTKGSTTTTVYASQSGDNVTGNYSNAPGVYGVFSGTVTGKTFTFTIFPTKTGCTGVMLGTGFITIPQVGNPTMTFSSIGYTTCSGADSGTGILTKQ
jgi:hypothetical protein